MANFFDDTSSDTTHENHPTLEPNSTFTGRFENPIDPVFGPTTDFDFFQLDLADLPRGTKIKLTFTPANAVFYRITARLDEDANLHASPAYPGSNMTWIAHEPGIHINDKTGSFTWKTPNLTSYTSPAVEFQLRGASSADGINPLDYTVTFTAVAPAVHGKGSHDDEVISLRAKLRLALYGEKGEDFLWSGQKNDNVHGGQSRDILIGDNGDDKLYGDDSANSKGAADQLLGGGGNDTCYGAAGNDYINGEWDNDTLKGGDGKDYMLGGYGEDNLSGGSGNDLLWGGSPLSPNGAWFGNAITVKYSLYTGKHIAPHAWTIAGEAQFDDTSDDVLSGGAGNDVLIGGLGHDILTGGTGRDRFVFESVDDSQPGPDHDEIRDFRHSQGDTIDLRNIDADSGTDGVQHFQFIGTSDFQNVAGELRFAGQLLQGDVNGDGVADFEVLMNATSLVNGDLLLS